MNDPSNTLILLPKFLLNFRGVIMIVPFFRGYLHFTVSFFFTIKLSQSLDVLKDLKDPSQPPPFSIPSKLLTLHGEAKSYCFTVSCVPESVFNYLL